MSLLEINAYDINRFKRDPRTLATAQQIYKVIGPVHLDFLHWFSNNHQERPLGRQYGPITWLDGKDFRENLLLSPHSRLVNISLFYYIEYLKEIEHDRIIDIGCASNFLKKIYNQIYGISNNLRDVDADEHDSFGPRFVAKHADEFRCAMAICSLHFISLKQFTQRVLDFASIIAPGGRGLATFNIIRMVELTSENDLIDRFRTLTPTRQQLAYFLDQEIRKLPLNFLVVDNIVEQVDSEIMNGNLRLVFEK